ncbi:hypothetical protein I4U23_020934 [Adineta vaga]|nr:hypothetical protein I4U23_020934 [Adineta vaga]
MGCDFSKTATVVPVGIISDEKHLLASINQTEVKEDGSTDIPSESIQSKVVSRVLSSKSNKATQNADSLVSNHTNEINSNQSLSMSNQPDYRSLSSHSKEVMIRPTTAQTCVVKSFPSESSENDSDNETLDEAHRMDFRYDDIVSSSSSADMEKTLQRRFIISKFNNDQNTMVNSFFSDSDESYPLHQSIVTSSSSSSSLSADISSKQNIKRNINIDEIESNTELRSSLSSDSEYMIIHQNARNKLKSPSLMTSDNHQKPIVYETSYESEIDLES